MSTSARYLSKSRFKLALECVTKLYYTGKKKQYADESLNDPFLKTLAEGGFQVGEIAKYLFCEDPVADGITIDSLDYKVSLDETEKRLNLPGKVVIAEAAFLFRNLFIRADIVVKEGKTIDLYEVKAKSIEGEETFSEDKFLSFKGKENECISANWQEYFYDLAFQKYVITQSLTGYDVRAHLLLTDKDAVATIDGLNQKFKITREKERTGIIVETGLKASSLGNIPLRTINLDKIIDKIWNVYDVPSAYRRGIKFLEFVALCEDLYLKDNRQFEKIGSKCKGCQFYAEPVNADGLKSGFHECWKNHTNYSDELLSKPHVIDLWGGRTNKYIEENIFLLENINENEILEKENKDKQPAHGLSAAERKAEQILRARSGTNECFFDIEGITNEINKWTWPLHMIDFETSMVALPFYKNTKPYQGIAFQFSQHLLHKDGRVEHTHQYLNLTQGFYPNVEFVKTLKKSLAGDN